MSDDFPKTEEFYKDMLVLKDAEIERLREVAYDYLQALQERF